MQAAHNPGFVHTPSLTQASTVALLRSGHLAHASSEAPTARWPLTCRRSGCAWRRGCSTACDKGNRSGALLGYRFERRLQEAGKAQFIAFFRELAPLVARKLASTTQPGQAVEAIAANNVVDGLELHRRWLAALDRLQGRAPGASWECWRAGAPL